MAADVRLALIMGGGVSLGTYTAGAVTEIYYALKQLNPPGKPRVRVEVLVGASAGAMTAALFAKALACDDPASIEALHEAWVEQIDISKLAPPNTTAFNQLSVLMPDVVESIAHAMLTPPPANAPWTYTTPTLRLAFTGTNLGGFPLAMKYDKRDGAMTFDNHADAFFFETKQSDSADVTAATWTSIKQAAITSGAFPAAFPPRVIQRSDSDRPYQEFAYLQFPEGTAFPLGMSFCDGGVFDNEPIGLSKKLVQDCPDHGKPGVEYRYVVIDHDLSRNTWRPCSPPTNLEGAMGAVASAVMEQGTSKDYLRAQKINDHANSQRVAAVGQLRPMIDAANASGAPLIGPLTDRLARTLEETIAIHFFSGSDRPTVENVAQEVNQQRARIDLSPDYTDSLAGLEGRARSAMIDAIVISEVTAGLLDKGLLQINIVAPPTPPSANELVLAGAFLWNFGGFFERLWRQHDFDCGRRDARQTLAEDMGLPYPADPNANYAPLPVQSGTKYVSPQRRADLLKYLTARTAAIIRPPLDQFAKGLSWPTSAVARTIIPSLPKLVAKAMLRKIGLGSEAG
jgi:hypothetical protein